MKCVFTTNDKSDSTYSLLKAAINSLQQNTSLTPVVVWSGASNDTTRWLNQKNVQIVNHELTFKDQIQHFSFGGVKFTNENIETMYNHYGVYYSKNFIETESLRLDLPTIFSNDEYVLYSDCDVLFLKDLHFDEFKEPMAAVMRDDGSFNNGVMVMNIPKLLEDHEGFIQFYIDSNYSFKGYDTTTEGAYNMYYNNRVYPLPVPMNWHVKWNRNDDASVLHFCGPKPWDYAEMFKQVKDPKNNPMTYDPLYYDWFKLVNFEGNVDYFITLWNNYAEEKDRVF